MPDQEYLSSLLDVRKAVLQVVDSFKRPNVDSGNSWVAVRETGKHVDDLSNNQDDHSKLGLVNALFRLGKARFFQSDAYAQDCGSGKPAGVHGISEPQRKNVQCRQPGTRGFVHYHHCCSKHEDNDQLRNDESSQYVLLENKQPERSDGKVHAWYVPQFVENEVIVASGGT